MVNMPNTRKVTFFAYVRKAGEWNTFTVSGKNLKIVEVTERFLKGAVQFDVNFIGLAAFINITHFSPLVGRP